MLLDRTLLGRNKYALLKLRNIKNGIAEIDAALRVLGEAGILDWGNTPESEFFVIRLKDKYADDALFRYALSARMDGEDDYARDVEAMAERAGINHPNCKKPD